MKSRIASCWLRAAGRGGAGLASDRIDLWYIFWSCPGFLAPKTLVILRDKSYRAIFYYYILVLLPVPEIAPDKKGKMGGLLLFITSLFQPPAFMLMR